MFSCLRRMFKKFFQVWTPKFAIVSGVFFSGRIILKNIDNKKGSRGVWGHASPKNFWKFTYCNGHFSTFWTIFRQILFTLFTPESECFTEYDAFLHFRSCELRTSALLLSKRFEMLEKLYSSKTCLKMAGGGMHPPHLFWICLCLHG